MVEVLASVEFSENSPYPEGAALWEDVYAEPNYPFIQKNRNKILKNLKIRKGNVRKTQKLGIRFRCYIDGNYP
jgi:hypothetical protein